MKADGELGGESDLKDLLSRVLDTAISITGADFGNIQLIDPDSGDLRIVVSRGFPEFWLEYWNSASRGKGVCGTALESGKRVIVEDVAQSPIFVGTPSLEVQLRAGIRAVQSTPLVSRSGKTLGMFSTHYKASGRPSDDALRSLDLLAQLAAESLDREQTQLLLRESEERFRALVRASSGVIYRMSPDWSEMRELVGRGFIADTSEPDRHWIQKYIHPDDQPEVLASIHEAIRTRSTFQLEHRVLREDGSIGWTFSRAIPILNSEGLIIEWFGAASDITSRKRAEKDLQESELSLRAFFQTRAVGAAEAAPDGRFLRVNETLSRLTGYSVDELLNMRVFDLSVPEVLAEVKQDFFAYIEGHSDFRTRTRLARRKDSQGIWLQISSSLLRDAQGNVVRVFGVFQDVTEQLAIQNALAQRELKFRTLAEAMPEIVWSATPEGARDYHNQRWGDYTGLSQQKSQGWGWVLAVYPEDLPTVLAEWTHCYGLGQSYQVEYRLRRHPDGEYRWHQVRALPVREEDGKITKWIGSVVDIHEQKVTVQRLQSEQSLRETFVNTLTHDLRTPLTAARLNAQLLEKKNAGQADQQKIVTNVMDGLDRMDKMIRSLLDANRIRAGERIHLSLDVCDPNQLAADTLAELRCMYGDRFVLNTSGRIEAAWDSNAVRRILENLCINAVKYGTPDRPVVVSVINRGSQVKLSVHNDGKPIPPAEQDSLFVQFRRTTTAMHGGQKGWGLGLVLVKGLTEAHGGAVTFESSAEHGTTFTVELPVDAAHAAAA